MRSKGTFLLMFWALWCVTAFAQGRGGQTQPPPATDKVTPNIPGVVAAGTKIEVVKYGLRGSDGGVGLADGSVLITTGGGVAKVDKDGNVTMLVDDAGNAAGLAVDSKGRVIGAQYSKKVSVLYPKGSEKLLADSYEGKPFIRPNDLVVDKKGGIYFTDCYQAQAKPKPDDLPQAVYYLPPGGKIMRVSTDINRPNGITLSPDEKILDVNDWDGKFDVKQETDHGLVSGADGLCSDSRGNTFATTPAGVQVFNAKGEHLGNIEVPLDQPPQNCGFAGADKKDLFVVGRGVVLRIHTMNAGPKDRAK